ncbi:MAG: hypothetical protein ABR612_14240 [Chromatocurvus sp.]
MDIKNSSVNVRIWQNPWLRVQLANNDREHHAPVSIYRGLTGLVQNSVSVEAADLKPHRLRTFRVSHDPTFPLAEIFLPNSATAFLVSSHLQLLREERRASLTFRKKTFDLEAHADSLRRLPDRGSGFSGELSMHTGDGWTMMNRKTTTRTGGCS